MSTTYPKIINIGGGTANFANLYFTNGIPIVAFGYTVYENGNNDTGTYDSANTILSFTPLSEFTYTYIADKNDSDKVIQLTVECGAYTFIFNVGEYFTNTDLPLNLNDVVTNMHHALGL